jgi:tetratricopeptide (TPR) repeat protein
MKRLVLGFLAIGLAIAAVPADARETPSERRAREAKEAQQKAGDLVKPCQDAYTEKRHDDVITACTKLIDSKGITGEDLGSIHLMRGVAHQSKDDCAKAIVDFDAAEPLRPQDYQVPFLQYICATKLKDDAKAEAALDKAITLKPDDPDLLRSRCVSRVNAKKYDVALPDCEKLVSLKSDDADIWLVLGQIYETNKQADKAKAAYAKVLAIKPGHPGATDGVKRLGGK